MLVNYKIIITIIIRLQSIYRHALSRSTACHKSTFSHWLIWCWGHWSVVRWVTAPKTIIYCRNYSNATILQYYNDSI